MQARTDMRRGRISEKKMEAVWDRTRAEGPADVRRFRSARHHYHGRPHCEQLRKAAKLPRSQRKAAGDCITRARTANKAVAAAKAAIGDWSAHLKHMASYSDGGMTAGKAQHLWVQAWRAAPDNINDYTARGARLHRAPPCDPAKR